MPETCMTRQDRRVTSEEKKKGPGETKRAPRRYTRVCMHFTKTDGGRQKEDEKLEKNVSSVSFRKNRRTKARIGEEKKKKFRLFRGKKGGRGSGTIPRRKQNKSKNHIIGKVKHKNKRFVRLFLEGKTGVRGTRYKL